ncbi:hypothetical protein Pa193_018 [Pseudomonas virus Pa193]|uniref:Uncharacterized protein n=1 Tax=Pseudomonas virus Pa193 TaxID=2590837 RepID=A0A5P1KV74_9CAUD|nr:hypothetical protein H6S64_gp18 [Pseudomonas virus Pa193]QDH45928.1 hypothetical protein Pa193_018 [Pseudomonas virus Pa193]
MQKYAMSHIPRPGTLQFEFECLAAAHFGINDGALAMSSDGERYCNEHIDWLWRQFLASKGFR